MTNVNCCGEQDRNTTTSETHPTRPPNKTRNCYKTGDFDANRCGGDDRACQGVGSCDACTPDDHGGYCDHGGQYYVSSAKGFTALTQRELYERHGSDTTRGSDRRRDLYDYERRVTDRIRELQILGKDPLMPRGRGRSSGSSDDNTTHDFASSYLTYMGIGVSSIILIISIFMFLMQNNFFRT